MRSRLHVVIIIIIIAIAIITIVYAIVLLLCGVHETGSEAMRLHVIVGRYTQTANSVNIILTYFYCY